VLWSLCVTKATCGAFFFPCINEVPLSLLSIHGEMPQAKNCGTRERLFALDFSRERGSFVVTFDGR
jgi:hypothetical protein